MNLEAAVTEVTFPRSWQPVRSAELVRLGRDFDGGYIVDERDVQASDALIAMGIDLDWSFEKDFVLRKRVPVTAYDGSVDRWKFLFSFLRSIFQLNRPGRMVDRFHRCLDFWTFFRGRNTHERIFVGLENKPGWVSCRRVFESASQAGHRKCFIKIDIEGSEYDILDCLKEMEGMTTGLAIEFHDVEANEAAISRFVDAYALELVHIHVNNFTSPGPGDFPLAIEMTFSASENGDQRVALPHALDKPNDPDSPDYQIAFAD